MPSSQKARGTRGGKRCRNRAPTRLAADGECPGTAAISRASCADHAEPIWLVDLRVITSRSATASKSTRGRETAGVERCGEE